MLTKDLTGALLDCWVQKAINPAEKVYFNSDGWTGRWHIKAPAYSTEWEHGGPVIERERITLYSPSHPHPTEWAAMHLSLLYERAGVGCTLAGPTPLTAAMRAFVVSKFGDEVPDSGDTGSTGSGNE